MAWVNWLACRIIMVYMYVFFFSGLCLAILAAFLQNRICSSHHTPRQLLLHQIITVHSYTASTILHLISTCIYYPHVGEITLFNTSVLLTFMLFLMATVCYSAKMILLTELPDRGRTARRNAVRDDDIADDNDNSINSRDVSIVFSPFHWLPSYDEVTSPRPQRHEVDPPPRYSTLHLNMMLDTETNSSELYPVWSRFYWLVLPVLVYMFIDSSYQCWFTCLWPKKCFFFHTCTL